MEINNMKLTKQQLNEIIELHQLWLEGKVGGVRANLSNDDLSGLNLRNVDLRGAYLHGADLRDTDLQDANLSGADLRKVDLRNADLKGTNLHNADLRGVDLIVINLQGWEVYIYADSVRVGQLHYSHEAWLNFSDKKIQKMHPYALKWWKKHKLLIASCIETIKDQVANKQMADNC
jgi:uncharacterized protein YjbI with pentapeptide repeats